jgi:threonine/homoserine/homoserine lactone efflux protein
MLEALAAGAIAGYAIAIPVGAIAVLIIHTGLQHGLRAGLAAGAGAATADGVYALVAVLAGAATAGLVGDLQDQLRLVAGVVLIGIALRGLLTLRRTGAGDTAPGRQLRDRRHRRTFGVLLGLTLLNPITVVYFGALVVGLPQMAGALEQGAFVTAVFLASLSWQSTLAVFGAALGRGSTAQRLRWPTTLLGNLVVLGFGVYVMWQALAS